MLQILEAFSLHELLPSGTYKSFLRELCYVVPDARVDAWLDSTQMQHISCQATCRAAVSAESTPSTEGLRTRCRGYYVGMTLPMKFSLG